MNKLTGRSGRPAREFITESAKNPSRSDQYGHCPVQRYWDRAVAFWRISELHVKPQLSAVLTSHIARAIAFHC
jgi:hypothetical protein